MVSVWDPLGSEKFYAKHLIGKIRKGHVTTRHAPGDLVEIPPSSEEIEQLKKYKSPKKPITKNLLFLHARELMSHPVETLTPNDTLEAAYEIFSEKRYRHIPIITEERKVVGILSDRSFLRENSRTDLAERKVEEIMSTPVLAVTEMTEVHLLAKIFVKERIGALPIINDEKRLIGIVTRSDLLRSFAQTEIFQANA